MVSNGMPEDVRNKIASLFISTFPLSMHEQSREKILNMMTKKEVTKNEVVQAVGKKIIFI